jgi:hypothetical protein
VFQTWTPHYFVLSSNKIYYSEETSHYQTAEEEEEEEEEEGGRGKEVRGMVTNVSGTNNSCSHHI